MNSCMPMNSRVLRLVVFLFFLAPFVTFGHDPYEITTRVSLRTNCLEVRMTLAAATAQLLTGTNETAGQEALRSALIQSAENFLRVSAANQPLAANETKVSFSVEDHVEIVLTYPRPGSGKFRLEAVGLAKLPDNEPYGAVLTAVDLTNDSVLGQKLLTARDSVFDAEPTTSSKPAQP